MKHIIVVLGLVTLPSAAALAHIRLDEPSPRYSDQKGEPCGKGGGLDARTGNVHTFAPGERITVTWTETVDHVGYFRISFDVDGADAADFNDPASFLLPSLTDPAGTDDKVWSAEVTLPDVECDNCTLQLIQDMGADDYFQCADIVLTNGGAPPPDDGGAPPDDPPVDDPPVDDPPDGGDPLDDVPPGTPPPPSPTDDAAPAFGCRAAGSSTGASALALLGVLVLAGPWRRRRRG